MKKKFRELTFEESMLVAGDVANLVFKAQYQSIYDAVDDLVDILVESKQVSKLNNDVITEVYAKKIVIELINACILVTTNYSWKAELVGNDVEIVKVDLIAGLRAFYGSLCLTAEENAKVEDGLLLFEALNRKGRNYRKTWFTVKEESKCIKLT